jgi:thiamine-phosphate pyrophosphorylase
VLPSFEATLERVRWWAEIFEAPCVAYAASLDEVAPLAEAGADFIALDGAVWDAASAAEAVRAATEMLARRP